MKTRRIWTMRALLVVSLAGVIVLSMDLLGLGGLGPNLGLPVGYYGRFNRVVEMVRANPDIEIVQTTLHKDAELEDFYITVRTRDEREVRLRFEGADTRPFDEFVLALQRVEL